MAITWLDLLFNCRAGDNVSTVKKQRQKRDQAILLYPTKHSTDTPIL